MLTELSYLNQNAQSNYTNCKNTSVALSATQLYCFLFISLSVFHLTFYHLVASLFLIRRINVTGGSFLACLTASFMPVIHLTSSACIVFLRITLDNNLTSLSRYSLTASLHHLYLKTNTSFIYFSNFLH